MLSQFTIFFSLWIVFQTALPVSSFQCYVCAPDEGKPEDIYTLRKSFPAHNLQPCSKYNKSNKHLYLLDCPTGNNGCLTKFEASGSVMRSCAPIAIEDCKEANGINYCYCKKEGCNTPDRKLSEPHKPHKPDIGKSQAAARVSADHGQFNRYFDDEDIGEGSGEWGDFYYDDYNYIGGHSVGGGGHHFDTDDSEFGDGAHDDSDMTEPPPFVVQEDSTPTHKYDRAKVTEGSSSDITIDDNASEERARPSSAGRETFSPALALLILLLVRL